MPRNFVEELDRELRQSRVYSFDGESAKGYVEEIFVSKFHANVYMAGLIINHTAVMATTRFSDIPIIAGDCRICIKSFTMGNYEIVCTSEENLCKAMQFLPVDIKAIFPKAAIPLFDSICPLGTLTNTVNMSTVCPTQYTQPLIWSCKLIGNGIIL